MTRRTETTGGILCGTDFSDAARGAADVAAALAARMDVPLRLLHVEAPGPSGGRPVRTAAGRDQLGTEASRLRDAGARVVATPAVGHADEVLVEQARSADARLIVVGSQGTRAARGRLGSVSERTAEAASSPTLVVRSPRPFLRWLAGRQPLRIFVGFDFTVTAEAALDWAAEFRQTGGCEVTVGFTNWPEARVAMGFPADPSAEANPAPVQAALERDLRSRVTALLGDEARVVVRAARGRADLGLMELAAESKADLIVVGSHQQQGLARYLNPSVSRGLLHHAPCSVVVVPAVRAARGLPPVPVLGRVLVATDLSPLGNRAIAHACAVAAAGGVVRVVHVVHPQAVGPGEYENGLLPGPRHDRYLRTCGRKLHALVPADAAARGLSVEARVVEADEPATGVVHEAERFAADVIVMGSQGRSALGQVVLGSVAQSVMATTTRPVFVVRFPRS